MRFWRRNTSKYERYKGRKSPDCLAITVSRRTVESCLYRQVDGVLSKQMPSQDGQGRKLPHIVSIVANVLITEVEGHYQIFRKLLIYPTAYVSRLLLALSAVTISSVRA
jgi:hypothetical protein